MHVLRSVFAVTLGYFVFAASAVLLFKIAGKDPHAPQHFGLKLFTVIYGIVFAGMGGLLAARIAPAKGTLHAAFLMLLIAIGATVSLIASGVGSTWSQWAALLLMAPSAWGAAVLFGERIVK